MKITVYTLKAVAYAITDSSFVFLLLIMALIFYRKNKKTAAMQKMIIGESIHSPFELTISQIVLGILAGALGSLMLSYLGVIFKENSAVYLIFIISILLTFVNPKYICFSYSGAILGFISIISRYIVKAFNINGLEFFNINIISLMSLVGVLHIIEGLLVMGDGNKGSIPIFANRDNKVIGGFALRRYWALPIAIFIIFNSNGVIMTENVMMPEWWPVLNGTFDVGMVKNAILQLMPLYGVVGYSSITFTKSKRKKSITSGALILTFGITLVLIAQIAAINPVMEIFVIIFTPLAHEVMLKFDKYMEVKGEPKYVSSNEGMMVLEVAPKSPAYEMGIESGDMLLEVNNKKIQIEEEMFSIIKDIPNFLWLKIKKQSGELKEVSYNKMREGKRLGLVFVPRHVPGGSKVIKYETNKFKDVFDKIRNKDEYKSITKTTEKVNDKGKNDNFKYEDIDKQNDDKEKNDNLK
jgi:hypothetical protein